MTGDELACWLVEREERYGGVQRVARGTVSPYDHRTGGQLAKGTMTGGDRMSSHGYAPHYAEHLLDFLGTTGRLDHLQGQVTTPLTIVEIGILRGTGLALWCDLFPAARVIGLDVDLGHFDQHLPELRALGAFADNQPEVHAFDVLAADDGRRIDAILGGSPVDILIDDALHTSEAILRAFRDFRPRLADAFLYFVEDNAEVHEDLAAEVDGVLSLNELTVVRR